MKVVALQERLEDILEPELWVESSAYALGFFLENLWARLTLHMSLNQSASLASRLRVCPVLVRVDAVPA